MQHKENFDWYIMTESCGHTVRDAGMPALQREMAPFAIRKGR
jgi:hypothetical protein